MKIKNYYLFDSDVEKIKRCFDPPIKMIYNDQITKTVNKVIRSCYTEKELKVFDKFFKNGVKPIGFTIMEIDGKFKIVEDPKFAMNPIYISGSLPYPSDNLRNDKEKIIIDKLNEYTNNNPDNPITEYVKLVHHDMKKFKSPSTFNEIEYLYDIPSEYHKYIDKSILDELEERDNRFYQKVLNLFGNDIEVPNFKKDRIISYGDMSIIVRILAYIIYDKFDKIAPSDKEVREWIEENVDKFFTDEEKQVLMELDLGWEESTRFYIREDHFSNDSKGNLIIADTFDVCSCGYDLGIRNASSYVLERLNELDLSCIRQYQKRFNEWKEEKKSVQKNIKIIQSMYDTNNISEEFKKILKVMYDDIMMNENLDDDEYWFKDFYEELLER